MLLSDVRLHIINTFNELLFRRLELHSFENLYIKIVAVLKK